MIFSATIISLPIYLLSKHALKSKPSTLKPISLILIYEPSSPRVQVRCGALCGKNIGENVREKKLWIICCVLRLLQICRSDWIHTYFSQKLYDSEMSYWMIIPSTKRGHLWLMKKKLCKHSLQKTGLINNCKQARKGF